MDMLEYLSPDIWYQCSHTCIVSCHSRRALQGVETQLKFSISFEMKKS